MLLNAERPGVGEGAIVFIVEPEILGKAQELPQGRQVLPLAEKGEAEINQQGYPERRHDAEEPLEEEVPEGNALPHPDLCKELGRDQEAAQHKEEVDPGPEEFGKISQPYRLSLVQDNEVVKEDQRNGQGPEVVEAV